MKIVRLLMSYQFQQIKDVSTTICERLMPLLWHHQVSDNKESAHTTHVECWAVYRAVWTLWKSSLSLEGTGRGM